MINLWAVVVQDCKKPFSFTKMKLIKSVDESVAKRLHERAMKHVHIDKDCRVVWLCFKDEDTLGIKPKTYIYMENLNDS